MHVFIATGSEVPDDGAPVCLHACVKCCSRLGGEVHAFLAGVEAALAQSVVREVSSAN